MFVTFILPCVMCDEEAQDTLSVTVKDQLLHLLKANKKKHSFIYFTFVLQTSSTPP